MRCFRINSVITTEVPGPLLSFCLPGWPSPGLKGQGCGSSFMSTPVQAFWLPHGRSPGPPTLCPARQVAGAMQAGIRRASPSLLRFGPGPVFPGSALSPCPCPWAWGISSQWGAEAGCAGPCLQTHPRLGWGHLAPSSALLFRSSLVGTAPACQIALLPTAKPVSTSHVPKHEFPQSWPVMKLPLSW